MELRSINMPRIGGKLTHRNVWKSYPNIEDWCQHPAIAREVIKRTTGGGWQSYSWSFPHDLPPPRSVLPGVEGRTANNVYLAARAGEAVGK